MKPKTMILAVVAVGCGLVASYLTNHLLAQRRETNTDQQMVKVLLAKQKLPAFTLINEPEKVFVLADYPEHLAKNVIRDFDKLKGQRLTKPLEEDQPVFVADLLSKDMAGLPGMLQPGQRAIAIKVDATTAVSGWVLPGAKVDVICTMRTGESTAKVILQDMLVLAVDMTKDRNPDQPTILGQTVTLAAKPEEATRLALAASVGELRLSLRGLGDNKNLGQVITRVTDLDKPLADASDSPRHETEEPAPRSTASRVEIPKELPPVEEKKEKEPTPVVAAPKPERKPQTHTMTLIVGQSAPQKIIFTNPEDNSSTPPPSEETQGSRPEGGTEVKSSVKPTVKPVDKPADKNSAAPGAYSPRSTRTGRIGS